MNEIATMARPTNALVPTNLSEAMSLAEFMSRARTIPKHLWDNPGDCLMVVELAMRWGMSPFAVAQGTSVISGKLMFEGKLVAAAVENSGAITGQFDYAFAGEGEARTITVTATRRGETNPREVIVALKDARTNNDMWKKQPDQQLVYHGARVWARRWTPAVILGVYSREEFKTIDGEAISIEDAAPSQRDQINADVPLKAAAASTPRAPVKRAPVDAEDAYQAPPPPTGRRTAGQLLDGIEKALHDATSRVEVDRVLDVEEVFKFREHFADDSPPILRLNALRDAALERHPPVMSHEDASQEPDPDLEIVGEKYAAG